MDCLCRVLSGWRKVAVDFVVGVVIVGIVMIPLHVVVVVIVVEATSAHILLHYSNSCYLIKYVYFFQSCNMIAHQILRIKYTLFITSY